MRRVGLEPSDPGQHAERLLGWLRQPHVAWWWGDAPQAMEQVMRCVPEMPAVVAADGVAVDYLCWQKPPRQELEAASPTCRRGWWISTCLSALLLAEVVYRRVVVSDQVPRPDGAEAAR